MNDLMYPLDFIFVLPSSNPTTSLSIFSGLNSARNAEPQTVAKLFLLDEKRFLTFSNNNNKIIFGGDPIGIEDCNQHEIFYHRFEVNKVLNHFPGHYYLINYDGLKNELLISSSLFNMFPIYWYQDGNKIILSSGIRLITDHINEELKVNRKFILEQFLFNYPLFNETLFEGINLCPTNHYIKIKNGKITFIKHTDITKHYSDHPKKWKQSSEQLTNLFIDRFKDYIPQEKTSISFTGGFDGRTLVACANYYKQYFFTFSFGTMGCDDVVVPLGNSKVLNIPYKPIYLDTDEYVKTAFLATGKEIIQLTSGASNLLYTHFLYSAKILAKEAKYMYTGYFGSELFRALHRSGAMNSPELVSFIKECEKDKWIDFIKASPKLNFINKKTFVSEIDAIIEELSSYKKRNLTSSSTLNQFYYKYVFEEIFRKFFGTIIFAQSNYISVRTPFLDFSFIKELLKTELAGINNDFFTNNPIKRFKGQFLYANIIKKTYPELAMLRTQKGYCPADLLNVKGKINILFPFFIKRLKRKVIKPNLDNLFLLSGIKHNWPEIEKTIAKKDYFNIDSLSQLAVNLDKIPEFQRDLLALAYSPASFIKNNQ